MLNKKTLREQVYDFLRKALVAGQLEPGSVVNIDSLARELGISKTPLKEALIQLECEGFVSFIARRGILVNQLTMTDLINIYQIVGTLEAEILISVFDYLTDDHIHRMKESNQEQTDRLLAGDANQYYHLNLDFHDIFLKLSENQMLRKMIMPLKQRLYDFPRREYWPEWEQVNLDEHKKIIACIETGDAKGAADILKNEHWGWEKHKPYFTKFYQFDSDRNSPKS